jgi:hypothetical protein
MPRKKVRPGTKVRSAKTGRYVKKSKAITDPDHTVAETERKRKKK